MWYKFSSYPHYYKKEAAMNQTHPNSRRSAYFEGLRDGFPIGLGYLPCRSLSASPRATPGSP